MVVPREQDIIVSSRPYENICEIERDQRRQGDHLHTVAAATRGPKQETAGPVLRGCVNRDRPPASRFRDLADQP